MIKVGSDFSGVGAFNQALMRLGINYEEVFACDMDKYARETFIHNYGEPKYYPMNVYDREIPSESLDIYMTSPPCQAFSIAGKRLGKDDKRGVLFFNSHEFIQVNKPLFFIFENVKGLLSDDNGNTFNEWVNLLGGKSVNGNAVLFPHEESVPYHLYWKVLNAKEHGVPQNRERVFLIGIRDDKDNSFRFPVEEHLTKRLKDVLENSVDDKYFLSKKMINVLAHHKNPIIENENPNNSACIHAGYFKMGGRDQQYLKIKSATSKGYEEAHEGDSINFTHPNSETRRGRVGHGVAQTIDCSANQGVVYNDKRLTETVNNNTFNLGIPSAIDSYNKSVSEVIAPTVKLPHNDRFIFDGFKIRRLTPRECFRLMDFPESFTWTVSDSQAYKQAGNSIVVRVLEKIINNLNLTK
jgi:DNA (cytosine-5)-methyltransferase 1